KFADTARLADIRIVNNQMRGLIFFVLGAGVIKVSQLVEGKFPIASCRPEQMCFRSAIGWKLREFFHSRVTGSPQVTAAHAAAAGELLNSSMEHTAPEAVLEALM